MRYITITTAAAVLLVANSAAAATERFACRKANEDVTIVDLDRAAKVFNFSEGGTAQLDRQSACDAFVKIAGDAAKGSQPRCTVVFGQNAVSAEYVSLDGPLTFNLMVALDTKALTLTSIARIGVSAVLVDSSPCKRL